ncbi:DNA recombination protein RmuC [bacterium]|nr:DNA recombination protein RmuC [bacterium]
MDAFQIIIIIVFVAGFVAMFWLVKKYLNNPAGDSDKDKQAMLMIQDQIKDIRASLDTKLSESNKIMRAQFASSHKIVTDVTERLTKLDETNKQVVAFADQLQKLQDVLQNPKQRGVFGEYFLETLLKNAFQPGQYKMQYKFNDGEIVDAALFFGDKVIPIDSKFSLENYNRLAEEKDPSVHEKLEKQFKADLKNRIDETAKYIRPNEGTMELAFMFIPAEGIYYDLLVSKVGAVRVNTRDLIDYAINEKHVHIVSPTTFYVTLQSLLSGMRVFQIQEQTQEIVKNVGQLGKHLRAYEDYMKKLGGHLGTTVGAFNSAYKEFGKVDKDVVRLAGGEKSVVVEQLDRPNFD